MAIFARNGRPGIDAAPERAPSGCSAMFKALRDADVAKVDDCRDDIDTLLVFAGLYSAVLTAFVIESYTHLQQDTQDVIVGLLQQVAALNFTSGPGYLNSTNPSPSLPPFEPPLWAIRVNVLWFTSLLLSLSSASFGILVKQWLREYLALEYAAPRERLRARQYRNPAMSEWKVFEVAAFLPLLLQVSLSLFFVGLCFFTAAVHSSIGRTTAPLVCAWAFLLLMTTIAPLFSPRCPYKTTFLKRALRVGRYYVSPPTRRLLRSIRVRLFVVWRNTPKKWMGVVDLVHRTFRPRSYERAQWLRQMTNRPIVWEDEVACITRELQEQIETLFKNEQESMKEETDVVKTEAEDVEILLSVDALMSDDGLLPTMVDALQQQSGTGQEKTAQFILQIIQRRSGANVETPRLTSVPDLRPLSKYVWSAMTDALAGTLEGTPGPLDARSPDWMFNAVVVLLSPSQFQLSEFAVQALHGILLDFSWEPDNLGPDGAHLNHCLARASVEPSNTEVCMRRTMYVYWALLCQEVGHSHPSLRHLLDAHISEGSFMRSSGEIVRELFDVLLSSLLETTSSQGGLAALHGSSEALHIVLQHGEKLGKRADVVRLCSQALQTESGVRMILVRLAALHPQCRVSSDIQGTLRDVFRSGALTLDDRNLIRSQITSAFEWAPSDGDDDNIPLDYIRLCAACMGWMDSRTLAKAIEKYHETQGWQEELLRRDYWCGDAEPSTPEELFKQDQDMACKILTEGQWCIGTGLKDALWLFVPTERREEVLRAIHARQPGYMPRACTVSAATQEDLGGDAEEDDVGDGAEEGEASTEPADGHQALETARATKQARRRARVSVRKLY